MAKYLKGEEASLARSRRLVNLLAEFCDRYKGQSNLFSTVTPAFYCEL
jgi:hypothetical protein